MSETSFNHHDIERPIKNSSREVEILSGPISFHFYPDISGKRILLLGDKHVNESLCENQTSKGGYEVHKWLKDLSEIAPQCLDIFCEDEYYVHNLPPPPSPILPQTPSLNSKNQQRGGSQALKDYDNPLSAVGSIFIPYMFNQKCSDIMRYHYIDIRSFIHHDNSQSYIRNLFYYMDDQISNNDMKYFNRKWDTITKKDKLIKYYLGFDLTLKDLFIEYCQDCAKIANIKLDLDQIRNEIQIVWGLISKRLSKTTLDTNRFFSTILPILARESSADCIQTAIMDVYTILRIFTRFQITNIERGPLKCYQKEISNVIIYAGNFHIQVYVQFFQDYFEIKPLINHPNQNDTQCIQLEKPFDYFQGYTIKKMQNPVNKQVRQFLIDHPNTQLLQILGHEINHLLYEKYQNTKPKTKKELGETYDRDGPYFGPTCFKLPRMNINFGQRGFNTYQFDASNGLLYNSKNRKKILSLILAYKPQVVETAINNYVDNLDWGTHSCFGL